jgi:predicted DNA-binding transcriptional regulator AlpA
MGRTIRSVCGERWPFFMRREECAAYFSIGTTEWDKWVDEGLMPKPIRKGKLCRWIRPDVEVAGRAMTDGNNESELVAAKRRLDEDDS